MKTYLFVFSFFFFVSCSTSKLLHGVVYDKHSQKAISNAYIGVLHKDMEQNTDSLGNFSIRVPRSMRRDTLEARRTGYQRILMPIQSLRKKGNININLSKADAKEEEMEALKELNSNVNALQKERGIISDNQYFKLSTHKKFTSKTITSKISNEQIAGKVFVFMPKITLGDTLNNEPIVTFSYFDLPKSFEQYPQETIYTLFLRDIEENDPFFELKLDSQNFLSKYNHTITEALFIPLNEEDIKEGGVFGKCYLIKSSNRLYKFLFVNDYHYPTQAHIDIFLQNFEILGK